jgi:hypothetical protein
MERLTISAVLKADPEQLLDFLTVLMELKSQSIRM